MLRRSKDMTRIEADTSATYTEQHSFSYTFSLAREREESESELGRDLNPNGSNSLHHGNKARQACICFCCGIGQIMDCHDMRTLKSGSFPKCSKCEGKLD
jgi:hypothetical protein